MRQQLFSSSNYTRQTCRTLISVCQSSGCYVIPVGWTFREGPGQINHSWCFQTEPGRPLCHGLKAVQPAHSEPLQPVRHQFIKKSRAIPALGGFQPLIRPSANPEHMSGRFRWTGLWDVFGFCCCCCCCCCWFLLSLLLFCFWFVLIFNPAGTIFRYRRMARAKPRTHNTVGWPGLSLEPNTVGWPGLSLEPNSVGWPGLSLEPNTVGWPGLSLEPNFRRMARAKPRTQHRRNRPGLSQEPN